MLILNINSLIFAAFCDSILLCNAEEKSLKIGSLMAEITVILYYDIFIARSA